MSKLNELIENFCPEGVEYKFLGEICEIKTGKGITKNQGHEDAKYPIISGGKEPMGYYDIFNRLEYTVTISRVGANAGYVNFIQTKFYLNDKCFSLIPLEIYQSNIKSKFLFYYLKTTECDITGLQSEGGVPTINTAKVSSISIPIPPLPIQEEIVKILDKFTLLEAELEAELEARKKQYEHYRDRLLGFEGKEVEWKTLGEISNSVTSGGTPLANKQEYYNNGTIPWLRTQEVRFNEITKTEIKITELALKQSSAKWIPANCVIVAISGATAGRSAINKIPLTTNQHCCNLEIDPSKANYRYVFHWVGHKYEQIKSLGQGARADLNSGIIKSFGIAVPSLSEQERIVNILDKFDALVNDISIGLPAEIAARKKQYEYYRNRLLTFKPINE